MCFSTDSASRDIRLRAWDDQDGNMKEAGGITVPAGSGYTIVPPVDLMAQLKPAAQQGLVFGGGNAVQVFISAPTSAGTVLTVWFAGGYI
jgi:hypothetical protein